MPPASRGNIGSAQSSGGGVLPLLQAGAGARGNHRRGSGHRGGGHRRGWGRLSLVGLALVLVALLTTRSWPRIGNLAIRAAGSSPNSGHSIKALDDSRSAREGRKADDDRSEGGRVTGGGAKETSAGAGGENDDSEGSSSVEGGEGRKKLGLPAAEGPGAPGYPRGEDDLHVVFSTDCTSYQAWQAVVLFHSAILSDHMGPITQLISGCTKEQEQEMIDRHEKVRHSPNHRLFFSPSFVATNPQTGEPYPYMNKPNAMQLWFDQTEIEETIVALIDPDFIFLKPLTTWMSPEETVVRGDGLSLEGLKLEKGAWVRKGFPAGQRFGLPNWTQWDRSSFCPKDSTCTKASASTAKRYYDLIPPYLAHRDDWRMLLPEWVIQAPKVYSIYPSLLAEQTAYATAAATLNLSHYRLNNFAIENEKVDYELWDPVDHQMDNVCDIGIGPDDSGSRDIRSFDRMPHFIHYCHMYRVGQWLFNKRRYRKAFDYDQLQCSTPLLETPPMDIQENTFKMHPGARFEAITPRSAKRNAFVLCIATRFVNSALRRFKDKMCKQDNSNLDQTWLMAFHGFNVPVMPHLYGPMTYRLLTKVTRGESKGLAPVMPPAY